MKHSPRMSLEEEIDNNVEIREKGQKEGAHGNGSCDNIEQPLVEFSVPTGQVQQWLNITEEVMDLVRSAEVQTRSHNGVQ